MKLMHRRFLFAALLLMFSVATPLTIFYASGYRYNTRLGRIEQAGLLYVTTKQKDTKLVVDGQSYELSKQRRLANLRPRTYSISIEKEGFHTWAKRLEISEGQTTFIRDALLFADQEPEPFELFINALQPVSQNNRLALYRTQDYLVVYQKTLSQLTELPLLNIASITKVSLDSETDQAVFQQEGAWYQLSENTLSTITNIPTETNDLRYRAGTLYAMTDDKLWTVSTDQPAVPVLSLPLIQDIWPDGSGFWIITADPGKQRSFLYHTNQATARPRFLLAMPYSETIRVADVSNKLLTITDETQPQLHLVDANPDLPILTTLPAVHSFAWSASHSELLVASDFEVAIHHINNGRTQELLLRLSSPIRDIAWYPTQSHVLYTTDNALFVAERDGRDERNVVKLADEVEQIEILSVTETQVRFTSALENNFIFWQLAL
jgi:hypothetical protein